LLAVLPSNGTAQNYRIKIDGTAQAVSFRGLQRDSVDVSLVGEDANGGLRSPDGYAVRCDATGSCVFFRPGAILRGLPLTSTASAVVWGLGVTGLSLHSSVRVIGDVGGDRVLPGTFPTVQVLEGYAEYRRGAYIARGGRMLLSSRLEPMGFDGASVRWRTEGSRVDISGYAGWGLGQASVLPVTSPALNPLDDWRPRDRQLVTGAEASVLVRGVDLRSEYRREIDPVDHYFVSERAALSAGTRVGAVRANAGAEYNIADGRMGSADLEVTYTQPKYSTSLGARHYQPYFSLWTLWGAFSPVAYNAVHASMQGRPLTWLTLSARGERYAYNDAEISTGVVPDLRNSGWRTSTGASATLSPQWSAEGTYSVERGPGASGQFFDATVTYAPTPRLTIDAYGGTMARPLELRFYDATSRWIGGRASRQVGTDRRFWADVALVKDARDRPDAAASKMSQVRVRSGFSLAFGSKADRVPLPPARVKLP
jgi:hypothetical protein